MAEDIKRFRQWDGAVYPYRWRSPLEIQLAPGARPNSAFPRLVANITELGVVGAIVTRRGPRGLEVLDGSQCVLALREVNRLRRIAGLPALLLPYVVITRNDAALEGLLSRDVQ